LLDFLLDFLLDEEKKKQDNILQKGCFWSRNSKPPRRTGQTLQ